MSSVGVLMPVRDGARWIDEALDSVAAQTRPPDQVIVVDDGSRDDSRARAAARPFVTLVAGPEKGIVAAYEAALAACATDLVGFLGQDDRYAPAALERLAGALEADPDAGYAYGEVQLFADEPAFPGLRTDRLDRPYRSRVPESVLVRRTLLERVGLLDRASAGWDVDLFLRLDEAGARATPVDALVAHKRLHPGSTIHRDDQAQEQLLAALRRSIVRRREGTP